MHKFCSSSRSSVLKAQSEEWKSRQLRKINGGFKALAEWVGKKQFIVGDKFGLADVTVGSVCGYADVRIKGHPWRHRSPDLWKYVDKLNERQASKGTVPVAQKIMNTIV